DEGRGFHRVHRVPLAAISLAIERRDVYHARLREDMRPVFLGKVEIVLVERVLGIVPAAHHAAAAARAGGALGSIASEVRIRAGSSAGLSFRPFEYRDPGAGERA